MSEEYGKQDFVSRGYKVAIGYNFSVALDGLGKSPNLQDYSIQYFHNKLKLFVIPESLSRVPRD